MLSLKVIHMCVMKTLKALLLSLIGVLLISGCSYKLLAPSITKQSSLDGCKYFYMTPTSAVTSTTGGTYGNQYGVYGSTSSVSVNPTDEVSGYLIKKGYTRLPELSPKYADQTFIVNYSVSGRRKLSAFAYSTEVTLQFLSATNMEVIVQCTAEGLGSTETDDIRNAIQRCFEVIF